MTLARDMSIALKFLLDWRPLGSLTNPERWARVDARTSVEFYGHGMITKPNQIIPPETATPETVRVVSPSAVWPVEHIIQLQDYCFRLRDTRRILEAAVNARIGASMSKHHIFTGQWKDRIKSKFWHEAPTCECCDWSTVVHWRERVGQLPPSLWLRCEALFGDGGPRI